MEVAPIVCSTCSRSLTRREYRERSSPSTILIASASVCPYWPRARRMARYDWIRSCFSPCEGCTSSREAHGCMRALCIVALPPICRGMLPSLDLLRGLHIAAVPHCRHRRPWWFARDHEGVTGTLYRRPAAALQCLPVALQFRRCLDYVCIGVSQTSQSATPMCRWRASCMAIA